MTKVDRKNKWNDVLNPIAHPEKRIQSKHDSIGVVRHKADQKTACPSKKEGDVKHFLIKFKEQKDLHKDNNVAEPNYLRGLIREKYGPDKKSVK